MQTFLKPFILNCPKEFHQSLIEPILTPVVTFIGKKLDGEWKDVLKKGLVQAGNLEEAQNTNQSTDSANMFDNEGELNNMDGNVSDEILQQKSLRELTRTWCDIWAVIFQLNISKGETHNNARLFLTLQGESINSSEKSLPSPGGAKLTVATIKQTQKNGTPSAGRNLVELMQYADLATFTLSNMVSTTH